MKPSSVPEDLPPSPVSDRVTKCEEDNPGYLCFVADDDRLVAYHPNDICTADRFLVYRESPEVKGSFRDRTSIAMGILFFIIGIGIGFGISAGLNQINTYIIFIGGFLGLGIYIIYAVVTSTRLKSPFFFVRDVHRAQCYGNIRFFGDLLARDAVRVYSSLTKKGSGDLSKVNYHAGHYLDASGRVERVTPPSTWDKGVLLVLTHPVTKKPLWRETLTPEEAKDVIDDSNTFKKTMSRHNFKNTI